MTTPRSDQIDLSATPFYHVMSRCVCQSFLCGIDKNTNKDYSHRKKWVVSRIKYLADIFAIQICGYTVMSNHYHLVLFIDEQAAKEWSNEDVIERWQKIFPANALKHKNDPEIIDIWRERLFSISQFMQCLNQPIARAANEEDGRKGHFWEGRYKSQALLDEAALISVMAYVDLNPIRAGVAKTPEESNFTSIKERIDCVKRKLEDKKVSEASNNNSMSDIINSLAQPKDLMPFNSNDKKHFQTIDFSLADYLELVDTTGRLIRQHRPSGKIPGHFKPIMERLGLKLNKWLPLVQSITTSFANAIGAEVILINFNQRKKARKGISFVRKAYCY